MSLRRLLATTVVLSIAACAAVEPPTALRIAGSSDVGQSAFRPRLAEMQRETNTSLTVTDTGSGSGLRELNAGNLDIAMISAPMADIAAGINRAAPNSFDVSRFTSHALRPVPLAVIVHPSNRVPNLTMAQIRGILAGQITNWQQVGGPQLAIVPAVEEAGSGMRVVLEQQVMAGQPLVRGIREVRNSPETIALVSATPGAVSITSQAWVDAQVRAVDSELRISQQFFLVTRGQPSGAIQRVIAAAQR